MAENNKFYQLSRSRFGAAEMELMQEMFEQAPVLICILEGPDHRLKYMNEGFSQLYEDTAISPGTPAGDILVKAKEREEDVKYRLDILNRVYDTGEPFIVNKYKSRFDRSGNGVFEDAYFNVIFQPLKDSNGEVYGIFIAGCEITEQVQADRENTRHRLSLALEGGRIGYWEFDVKQNILYYISDLCKAHFGRQPEESFTHEDFFKAIHPDDLPNVKGKIKESIEEPGRYEVECRVQWPDGSQRWLLSRGKSLPDEQGHSRRMVGITMDITEQKKVEQQLKEAIQIRDDFLSIAAHELQTPVTSIKARAELFERRLFDAGQEAWARQAGKINERIDQLSRLTGSLLDISRIREGKLSLEKRLFPLGELITETAETMDHISHHRIEVKGQTRAQVHADRYRIGQVLTNLLENAIKYSPEANRIVVRISEKDDRIAVSVADFGIGISETDKEKVFERFYKGRTGNKDTYPGFGIGLFISAQIIERHGGSIWVEDNVERGSVFTFTLSTAK